MYTKTKINNLTKNNKILYEKDDWKLTAVYDYEGLIGEAIFDNHFTVTCLRKKEVFFRLTNFSLTNNTEGKEKNISKILLPIYILKNEKLKYYRQIERCDDETNIYDQLNVPTWIRKKDISNDIKAILSFLNFKNDNIAFLNEENFFIEELLKKEKNVEIYKIKNVVTNTLKFKNNNDYFILSKLKRYALVNNISKYVLINNINKNKNLLLILLTKLKHYKYKSESIKQIVYDIFENKHTIYL